MTRPPLACLPHWIGGQSVASRSARHADVFNPATGAVVRRVPLADAGEVDAAVGAALAAWPDWRAAPPLRRARILMRFRDLMDARKQELAAIVTEEHGKTLADAEGSVTRGIEVIEFATGIPHLAERRVQRERRRRRRLPLAAPAARRVRRDHAVQLPGDGAAVDVSAGAGLRQLLRAEALGARPVAGAAHGRAAARSGAPRRRVQRRPRRPRGGRRAARASGRQGDLVRRLDARRAAHLRDGDAPRQARAGAGRSQEPRHRAARRRPRLRDRGDHRRRVRLRRRALHGDLGGRRGGGDRRRAGAAVGAARAGGAESVPATRPGSRWGR